VAGPQLPSGIRGRIPVRHVPRRHSAVHRRTRIAHAPLSTNPDTSACSKLDRVAGRWRSGAHLLGPAKGDGKLTFDKLTDLYHSGTKHEEDQPAHLVIHDTNICNERCVKEFGNPCKNFCPANVYEMVEDADTPNGKRISLNPSNCVHCKTCDIMDPYEIITWVPPEGGGGPNYEGM
jgi:electron-transferring-flavoprotein dehydrogenase